MTTTVKKVSALDSLGHAAFLPGDILYIVHDSGGGVLKSYQTTLADLAASIFPAMAVGSLFVGGGTSNHELVIDADGRVLTLVGGVPAWAPPTGGGSGGNPPPVNAQIGTSYTLLLADAPATSSSQGIITMNNAGVNVVTIPPHSAVAWVAGTSFQIIQIGAGVTTVAAGSGVSVASSGSYSARAQNSSIVLTYLGGDSWIVGGDTA